VKKLEIGDSAGTLNERARAYSGVLDAETEKELHCLIGGKLPREMPLLGLRSRANSYRDPAWRVHEDLDDAEGA